MRRFGYRRDALPCRLPDPCEPARGQPACRSGAAPGSPSPDPAVRQAHRAPATAPLRAGPVPPARSRSLLRPGALRRVPSVGSRRSGVPPASPAWAAAAARQGRTTESRAPPGALPRPGRVPSPRVPGRVPGGLHWRLWHGFLCRRSHRRRCRVLGFDRGHRQLVGNVGGGPRRAQRFLRRRQDALRPLLRVGRVQGLVDQRVPVRDLQAAGLVGADLPGLGRRGDERHLGLVRRRPAPHVPGHRPGGARDQCGAEENPHRQQPGPPGFGARLVGGLRRRRVSGVSGSGASGAGGGRGPFAPSLIASPALARLRTVPAPPQ